MNITIFAGITGFNKTSLLRKFARLCLEKKGYPRNLDSKKSREYVRYIKFEEELLKEDKASTDISTFLDRPSLREKNRVIEGAFTRIGEVIRACDSEHFFIDIHLSYFRRSEFFPPLHLEYLTELDRLQQASVKVITLIDDVYSVWQNIGRRENKFPGTRLRLREILSWRAVEMLQADAVAACYTTENRNVKNYLVSVRHPINVLYDLVTQEDPVCAYLSFPITNVRGHPERVKEVNQFRGIIHQLFSKKRGVLFDPVTIDELALQKALASSRVQDKQVSLGKRMRWPIESNPLVENPKWPIRIPKEEVQEVMQDIQDNVKPRDFRLIDNSVFTVVYRPLFGGFSKGADKEIDYTIGQGKRVYIYSPKGDGKTKAAHPFDSSCVVFDDPKDLLKEVASLLHSS